MSDKLEKKINDLKAELHKLRLDNSMGRLSDFNKIRFKKKEIARTFTELNREKRGVPQGKEGEESKS